MPYGTAKKKPAQESRCLRYFLNIVTMYIPNAKASVLFNKEILKAFLLRSETGQGCHCLQYCTTLYLSIFIHEKTIRGIRMAGDIVHWL